MNRLYYVQFQYILKYFSKIRNHTNNYMGKSFQVSNVENNCAQITIEKYVTTTTKKPLKVYKK